MLSERVGADARRRRSRRGRRRDRSADGVSRARRARGGRHAGGRGPAGAAADDGAFGEGPRVPHGVRHRTRGRACSRTRTACNEIDGLEEERRLMYVAITRARRRLYLTHAQSRMLHGQTRYNIPSRFLDEIPRELVQWLSPQRRARAIDVDDGRMGRASRRRRAAARTPPAPAMAHRPERAPREVRRGRDHRRRRPRHRRARAGQFPRRRRQVARARVREARSGVSERGVGRRRSRHACPTLRRRGRIRRRSARVSPAWNTSR